MAVSSKAKVPKLRLLLADRAADELATLSQRLSIGGHRPEIARVETITAFRAELNTQRWDAVLCASAMPGLSPQTIARAVRESEMDIPVIALTDSSREQAAIGAMKGGVRDCLRRDQTTRLALVIEREVREARQRADHRAALVLLRDSEDRFRGLAVNLPGMVFQLERSQDGALRFLYVSEGSSKLIGIGVRLLTSSFNNFFDAIEPGDRASFLAAIDESAANVATLNWEGRIRARNRLKPRWVNLHSVPQRFNDGTIHWHGFASDITRGKENEATLRRSREQLAELSAYLEAAKEEERERIARDIHDELGSILVGIKIETTLLVGKLPKSQSGLREKLRAIESLLNQAMGTVSRVARELRPGILKEFGLPAALESHAEDFTQRTGIPCEVHYSDVVGVDERTSLALFRIAQEALTNVAKHARASRVALRLRREGRHVVLEIRDNGRGISEADMNKPKSFGLRGIRERSRNLHGEFRIASSGQDGTLLTIQLPVKHSPESEPADAEMQQNLF
jgi:two-component system, NarL family, sensor histidine kinase UhpB